MAKGKDPRARFRAGIAGLGRWRTLARILVPLHALLLVCLCLWVLSGLLPWVPALPLWVFLLPLPPAALLFWFLQGRRSRLDVEEIRDLLQAALEVEEVHPFAGALALQAEALLQARRGEIRRKSFAEARRPRPWYMLYALLAFLLLLEWAGPLPVPFPIPGRERRPSGVALAEKGGNGPGKGGGTRKGRNSQGRKKAGKKEHPQAGPSPRSRPRRKSPAPRIPRTPGQRRPGIRPRSEEKILFTPPPDGEGPRHLKKVYQTRGAPSLPPSGTRPGTRGNPGAPGRPGKARGRKKESPKARPRLARALERAAERALGDGLLSPGEAWLAGRMAEAWKR